jgi:exopolyphosphatase / guanosine-5'-triphosphate,3'-diphosphate pyrophosphatase
MRVAALDLGSNTTLLLIADVERGRLQKVICDETTVTKLGQGVHHSKRFHPEALERMHECLTRYKQIIDKNKVDKISAVATSAARDVENQNELMEMAKSLGIPLTIISGDKEAKLTFLGAVSGEKDVADVAVIDVGGGSTELIVEKKGYRNAVSVNVGSVRLTDLFVTGHPIKEDELDKARAYAREKFAEGKEKLAGMIPKRVIGVAGTPTTLAALEWNEPFSETKVHGFKLTKTMIEKWIRTMAPLSIAERETFKGLQPKRADVIVMGSIALVSAMEALEEDEMMVSVRGLRYGLAEEMGK